MSGNTIKGGRFSELSFLAKHSVIYGFGNMLSRIVAFVMLPIYTRHLTPFDYGVLEIVDTTISMIGLVAGLGIAGAMSRFYYDFEEERRRRQVVSTTVILAAATAAVIVALIMPFSGVLATGLFDNAEFAKFFNVALITLFLGLLIDAVQAYLRILQRSTLYVAISLGNLIISVSLNIYFVVFAGQGVFGILLASLIAKILIGVPLLVVLFIRIGCKVDRMLAVQMYKFSLPLIPTELASTAIGYSDRYFINHFLSTADAGIYGIAQKLGTVVHVLITSPFLLTYLPRRFEIAKQAGARALFSDVFYYHMLILIFASTMLAVFAPQLMVVLTTADYYRAADLIPLIAAGMIILGMKYHFQFGILYEKQTKYMMYSNFAAALVHVVLNFALIRYWGLWGALAASLAAYTCSSCLVLFFANRLYPISYEYRRLSLLAVVAITVVLASMATQRLDSVLAILGLKVALVLVFFWLLFAAQIISSSERQRLWAMLMRRSIA